MKGTFRNKELLSTLSIAALLCGCGVLGGTGTPNDGKDGGTGVQAKFSSLYGDYFKECQGCHAPNAPGRTNETEKTLNFMSAATAYQAITNGKAMGLTGNQEGCNGAPFIQKTAAQSLIYAVLDGPTRQAFDLPALPSCDASAISDMTIKVGSQPSAQFLGALKGWIEGGALNN
jgi:hypothetical protein